MFSQPHKPHLHEGGFFDAPRPLTSHVAKAGLRAAKACGNNAP